MTTKKNLSRQPLTPAEARKLRTASANDSLDAQKLRGRLNAHVAETMVGGNGLITVKDLDSAAVAHVIQEFRNAGWDVSEPRAVQDGDVVITIRERPAYHGCEKS